MEVVGIRDQWLMGSKTCKYTILISVVNCKFNYNFFFFFELNLQHIEVLRLGVVPELQLRSYATAIAMQDPSCISSLHHSSRQHWILNALSEARD